jgi:riboflavin kinase/FMN adenylyltransferase
MDILRSIGELARIPSPFVLAAGVFDGVHLGHRAVLDAAIETSRRLDAEPVVLTFDPHPATVLRPENPVPLLTPQDLKLRLIAETGIRHTLVVTFDRAFAQVEPEDFIAALCDASANLVGICIGEGWLFGKNRKGDPDLLRTLGMKAGFFTSEVPAVRIDNRTVSSTLIRQALSEGDMETANRYLGRPFLVSGTVISGQKLGSSIGFPTANIATDERQYPANGVYAIEARHGSSLVHGVANIGVRPTLASTSTRVLEAHLFDFDGDLYGAKLDISFLHRLRAERRFDGIGDLKAQIALDCGEARRWLEGQSRNR